MQKKIIGLLGGTFDPPTYGHLVLGCECLNLNLVDEVWMIPTGVRKDKITQTSPQVRLEMLDLFLQDFRQQNAESENDISHKIKINPIEVENGESIKTYFLIKQLEDQYKDLEFKWIIGSDLANSIGKWVQGEKLKQETNFIIFQRPEYSINRELAPNKYEVVEGFQTNISSTQVRNRLMNNQDNLQLFGIISPSVVKYIKQNSVYQKVSNEAKL